MEGQQVRKVISLKLREQPTSKVDAPTPKEEESGTVGSEVTGDVEFDYSSYKWDHTVNLIGRPIKDPLLHICFQCSLPVLIYGRMKKCRHAFCRDCAKKAGGVCPRCKEAEQSFEEASMGSVYVCTHGGGRYNNKGCGRSYLSQRDLDAHVLYRHNKDKVSLSNPPSRPTATTALPAGFTLPPFFQPGLLQGLPPPPPPPPTGYSSSLPAPPNMGGAMLRPMLPGSLSSGGVGAVPTLGGMALRPGVGGQPANLPPGSLGPSSMMVSNSLRAPSQASQSSNHSSTVLVPPFSLPPSSM